MSTTNLLEQGTSYLIVDCELTEFTRRLWLFVDAYNAVSDRGEASKVVHFVPAIMLRFRRRSGRDRRRAGYPCVFLSQTDGSTGKRRRRSVYQQLDRGRVNLQVMSKPGEFFLRTFFQELKTPPNGTNTENEELTWPYYSLLDAIMSGRAVNSPPCLVASASPGTGEQILEGDDGDVTLQEDQLQEEEEEPVRPPPKRRRSDDLTERLLHNMERQTELMEQIFEFFKARASPS
ncbi:hypothetical protein HPB47_009478 [Ixodes persulcatus]|uniref:Uncharacterized protein n=1 Tax=Ixodes persulcatus TaxID=34615 RepID=A0AC60P247_IXOPE|nr:hypothetical protein HPB47_009478 [Ixodes persulcatus]